MHQKTVLVDTHRLRNFFNFLTNYCDPFLEWTVIEHGFSVDGLTDTVLFVECIYLTEFSPRITVEWGSNGEVVSGAISSVSFFNFWDVFKPKKVY